MQPLTTDQYCTLKPSEFDDIYDAVHAVVENK
jgi:hypothetical protein